VLNLVFTPHSQTILRQGLAGVCLGSKFYFCRYLPRVKPIFSIVVQSDYLLWDKKYFLGNGDAPINYCAPLSVADYRDSPFATKYDKQKGGAMLCKNRLSVYLMLTGPRQADAFPLLLRANHCAYVVKLPQLLTMLAFCSAQVALTDHAYIPRPTW
jgi:hypothetical protein